MDERWRVVLAPGDGDRDTGPVRDEPVGDAGSGIVGTGGLRRGPDDTGLPFNPWAAAPHADPYGSIIDRAAAGLRTTGAFGPVERLTFTRQSTIGRDAWLERASTSGGINRLPEDELDTLLRGMGTAIDAVGGTLLIDCTTVAALAERLPD